MQPKGERKQKPDKLHYTKFIWFWLFLFLKKGLRLGAGWRTNLSLGGSNLTNINYANIGEQIKFIDTIKYYQQSLAVLDAAMTETEQQNTKKQCRKFIANHQKSNQRFLSCTQEAQ